MAYSKDSDLEKVQPNILDLGVDGWADQHKESELLINRDIKLGWFDAAANAKGGVADFDPDLIDPGDQLKRLSVFKTLELAYLFLMQDAEDDPFRNKMKLFSDKYDRELDTLISEGLVYDWSGDGEGEAPEELYANSRLLVR